MSPSTSPYSRSNRSRRSWRSWARSPPPTKSSRSSSSSSSRSSNTLLGWVRGLTASMGPAPPDCSPTAFAFFFFGAAFFFFFVVAVVPLALALVLVLVFALVFRTAFLLTVFVGDDSGTIAKMPFLSSLCLGFVASTAAGLVLRLAVGALEPAFFAAAFRIFPTAFSRYFSSCHFFFMARLIFSLCCADGLAGFFRCFIFSIM
mmetsp:Transcript_21653/g.62137  ORF Transcript_21653/g.62137 Transcript_21653/m.62137 type:complete len:203 (+) Transcript_21653:214-822(+)